MLFNKIKDEDYKPPTHTHTLSLSLSSWDEGYHSKFTEKLLNATDRWGSLEDMSTENV